MPSFSLLQLGCRQKMCIFASLHATNVPEMKMKNKLSPLLLLFTVLTATLMAVIPHHHHGDLSCFVMEMCQQDKQPNDSHTSHHQEGNDQGCAVQQLHQGFLKASQTNFHSTHNWQPQHHHTNCMCGDCIVYNAVHLNIGKAVYALQHDIPTSPAFLSLLLRAPPCALWA